MSRLQALLDKLIKASDLREALKHAFIAGFDYCDGGTGCYSKVVEAAFDRWYAREYLPITRDPSADNPGPSPVAIPPDPVAVFDECAATGRSCDYEFDKVVRSWRCRYCGKLPSPGQMVAKESFGNDSAGGTSYTFAKPTNRELVLEVDSGLRIGDSTVQAPIIVMEKGENHGD